MADNTSGNVSFIRIPNNIKQDFAPFQVNGRGLQTFSFKPSRLIGKASSGLLNMVPSSISNNTELFKYDTSYKYCASNITFNDILDMLPCIQIREYLPDTKLDQSINFFMDLFNGIFKSKQSQEDKDAGKEVDFTNIKSSNLQTKLTNVVNVVLETIDKATWLQSICGNEAAINALAKGNDKKTLSIVKFPYFLYYCLQSCRTTNIYELPCVPSNNAMYSSDGHPGWEGSSGMRLLPDFLKNIPVVGKMLDSLFGNMGINFTPWWDASKGSQTKADEIECKFSLFNDTVESAVNNFIFVTTVIAQSRWVQYNIMQHSSSLYDIAIPGIGKNYACMANFNVQYKGTLRVPSKTLFTALRNKVNKRYAADVVVNEQQIKIPDVYDITMKFQSLLPQNFNTFIYNFTKGNIESFNDLSAQVTESGFTKFTNAIKDIISKAATAWNPE